jgi:hypothetical protein
VQLVDCCVVRRDGFDCGFNWSMHRNAPDCSRGDLRKALDVFLREAAGEGEAIACLEPFGCTLSEAFH